MFGLLAKKRGPEILEIRIHGVKNTPPAEMLETTPENVQRDVGDELGSFWRRKDERPAHGITTTEAFSWGAQARTGGGALAAIGRAVVHVGWFLLLPFALANLAYWTRWIGPQTSAGSRSWNGDDGAATVRVFGLLLTLIAVTAFCSVAIDLVAIQCFRGGTQVCAALPAIFNGLRELDRDSRAALLGLAPIATILVLYVIGRRGRLRFEERVKKFGAGLDKFGEEEGLPLLATRGFWSVARIGQTSEWLHVAASITLVLFVLALDAAYVDVEDCWRGPSATITWACIESAWGHTLPFWFGIGALALMLVIIVLVAFASHTKDDTLPVLRRRAPRAPLTAAERERAAEVRTARKRGAAMACLLLSIAGYATWTILAFTPLTTQAVDGPGFLGLIATPIALIVLALFLALAGIGWRARSPWRRRVSAVLLVLGAAALLASHVEVGEWASNVDADVWRWALVGAAVLFVLIHLGITWSVRDKHVYEAWRGQGAGVVMILSLFASMALSSLLVLGVASWLGTPAEAAPTEYIWRTPGEPPPAEWWNVPDAYEWFAVVLTAIAALMLVLVLVALATNLTRYVRFSLPPLAGRDDDDERDATKLGGVDKPDDGYPAKYAPRLTYPNPPVRRRVAVRRSSHLLHRGEPLFGWLAVFAAVGFFSLSVVVGFEALPPGIAAAFNSVLVAVALAAVAAVVAHAASSSERPLGVFWDVVAFFPRAGHPFAPPCFGERVVPELAARTQSWLDDEHATRPRAVIFTAHSMGSTISAATLLALRGEEIQAGPLKGTQVLDRTALLSYGTQLRAYFSRFFPSVFGVAVETKPAHEKTSDEKVAHGVSAQGVTPREVVMPGPAKRGVTVLGVPGLLGPSLWRSDPWRAQVLAEFKEPLPRPAQGNDITLTALLGAHDQEVPRWRSLWRRTDFLGFPVYAYRIDRSPDGTPVGNPIDRGVTESVPASYLRRIADHSDYLGTPQFLHARGDLVRAFGGKP